MKMHKNHGIKRGPVVFLQVAIVAFGMGVLAFMLWEPHMEGRNAHATLFQTYFNDPFLVYAYLASIPFFVALWEAFRVLRYVEQNKAFSQVTIKALQTIKYCALITAGAIVAADAFLVIHARLYPEIGAMDGPEGALVLSIIATLGSVVVAAATAICEQVLQNRVDAISANDETV